MKGEISILGERRKSRFDPHLAQRIEAWDRELTIKEEAERLRKEREERLNPKQAKPAEEAKPSIAPGSGYALMEMSDTYALGVHALREACKSDSNCVHPTFVKKDGSGIYRPLTFEENIRARLDDYNTLNNPDGRKRSDEDRLRLFNTWLDSCTGIAYKKGATLFKMITESEDLIGIKKDFNGASLPVQYSRIQGAELDSGKGKYNQLLTLGDVLKHPGWNEAVTDNTLLKNYADIVFGLGSGNKMRFWVRQNTSADELRALFVYNIDNYSNAYGNLSLNYNGRFVRVTHRAPKAP